VDVTSDPAAGDTAAGADDTRVDPVAGVNLAPRATDPAAPARRRGKRWPAIVVLALVFVGGGIVVTKFLTSAIDYYCHVDEVGAKAGCETGQRLRIQGVVEKGTLHQVGGVTTFLIGFNGKTLPVRYEGDPGGIFQECVPVVVHGKLDGPLPGATFAGDQLEVKHSNQYAADNKGRLDQANTESAACKQQT
jgi:cytochrome c-type biogenesis protein CcmE